MKKYHVFKELGEDWSPIRKYQTDDLNDAKTMASLLKKQDTDHEYVIMCVVED